VTDAERAAIAGFYRNGASIPTIARRMSRSSATVYKVLVAAGVALRDRGAAIRHADRKPRQRRSLHDRLWEKIDVRGPDECWPFTGFLLFGYGRIALGRREDGVAFAHRLVAEEAHGPCPPGQTARHLCGNRTCCNPRHITWGDQSANERDKRSHGRDNRGERHGMSKVTRAQVAEIRTRAAAGESQASLAREFGLASVSDIVIRRTWAHVE
jgi:hypothetical protein